VRILGKMEMQNPFGSVKDRIAKSMIETAEKEGRLLPGQTILEPSSGNTGIALAAIAGIKGYPIKIMMPTSVSIERRQMLEVFGAELILTPGEEGSNGAVARAIELAAQHPDWYFPYQYANDANPRAHYEGTGPEILRDVPEMTHFVAGLGTSGTLMGAGRYFKEQNPDIQIIAVEPPLGERVEGLRNIGEGYIPPVFENWNGFDILDRKRVVRPRESIEWTRRLVHECGIFAGISAGAALAGAEGRQPDRRRARSCSSCATAAGSTCRPAPTPTISTRPKPRPKRSSTSERIRRGRHRRRRPLRDCHSAGHHHTRDRRRHHDARHHDARHRGAHLGPRGAGPGRRRRRRSCRGGRDHRRRPARGMDGVSP
jgi:[CysO sulfur-carrier protein]-thiocarboxylate-dependent cysteine synthase